MMRPTSQHIKRDHRSVLSVPSPQNESRVDSYTNRSSATHQTQLIRRRHQPLIIHNTVEPKALKVASFGPGTTAGTPAGLDDEDADPALGKDDSAEAPKSPGTIGAVFTRFSCPSLFSYPISISGFFGLSVRSTSFICAMKLVRFCTMKALGLLIMRCGFCCASVLRGRGRRLCFYYLMITTIPRHQGRKKNSRRQKSSWGRGTPTCLGCF